MAIRRVYSEGSVYNPHDTARYFKVRLSLYNKELAAVSRSSPAEITTFVSAGDTHNWAGLFVDFDESQERMTDEEPWEGITRLYDATGDELLEEIRVNLNELAGAHS